MIVQIAKRRTSGHFTVREVEDNGAIKNRSKTLVAKLPDHCIESADVGTVWEFKSVQPIDVEYVVNGFTVTEELVEPKSPVMIRPSGDLLAYWIAENIDGIGAVIASKLLRKYSADELNTICTNDPNYKDKLCSVSGITPERAEALVYSWPSPVYWRALEFLEKARLPLGIAKRLARVYGDELQVRLRSDPFVLMSFGISFEKIIDIAKKLDIQLEQDAYLAALAERITITHNQRTGSTVISTQELLKSAEKGCAELKITPDKLIPAAKSRGVLAEVEAGYQLLGAAIQEATVAKCLMDASMRPSGQGSMFAEWEKCLTDNRIELAVSDFESTLPFRMTDEQRQAVAGVIKSPVAVISGGAGTGKTTILLAVLAAYEKLSNGMAVHQVALSGRAAQRMSEATGREAMTIAKLIANYAGDNKPDLPEHMLLVIDEASMVDLLSAYQLVGLLPEATRIILVGDVAQLPPVGSGLVFHAAMKSDLPVFELTQVKRQGAESGIHQLALGIRQSTFQESLLAPKSDDVFYLSDSSEYSIIEAYFDGGGADTSIILTPTRKGPLGVTAINRLIQSTFDDESPKVLRYQDSVYGYIEWRTSTDNKLRLGDQIMVTANDYDEDIRNGDLGMIAEVFDEPVDGAFGLAQIDDREIPITLPVLEKLDLGYAITIHKSQGSQWETCLLLLPEYARHMLDQSLLYTAVTRPSKDLVIIGDKSLISSAINRGSAMHERRTNLLERLSA